MAGANYMGGKRNAARARGKDATAKVQRIHFGKRKLDILAKGLSNSRPLPSISTLHSRGCISNIAFEHAKRETERRRSPRAPCAFIQPPVTPDNLFRKDAGSGPLSASSTTTRSSANRTRSSRILSALDTSEPLFMRAEMDRLRSLPNLAGLSQKNLTAPQHTEESDENNRSPDPAVDTREYSSSAAARPLKRCRSSSTDVLSYSSSLGAPTFNFTHDRAESLERDEFAADYYPQPGSTSHRSTVQIRPPDTLLLHADYISQISFQQISHAETDFEPMPLDSSPPWHDDSGYAEFANDLTYSGDSNACSSAPAYEPTRYSFYDHSDSPVVSHREESFSSPSMWSSSRSMRSLHPAFADGSALELRGSDFGSRSTSMSPRSTFWSISSPSRLEGPRLAFARQLSHNFDEPHVRCEDAHYRGNAGDDAKASPFDSEETRLYSGTPSDPQLFLGPSSALSIHEHADAPSMRLSDNNGPPVAFVTALAGSDPLPYFQSYRNAHTEDLSLSQTPPAVQSLLDAMHGELFEGSDPWTALDRILGLENTVGYPDLSFGNLPESLAEGDRSGVGYHKSKANGSLRTAAAGVEAVEGCCLRETSRQKALGSSDASRSSSAVPGEREPPETSTPPAETGPENGVTGVAEEEQECAMVFAFDAFHVEPVEPDSGSSEPLLPRYTTTASGASAESEIRDGVSPERPPENSTEGAGVVFDDGEYAGPCLFSGDTGSEDEV